MKTYTPKMGTKTIEIKFMDMDLEVTGYYEPAQGQTWEDPPYPAEITIEKIMFKGVDVADIFYAGNLYGKIEELCFEALNQ